MRIRKLINRIYQITFLLIAISSVSPANAGFFVAPRSITAGAEHACSLMGLGKFQELKCWGRNDYGQVGNHTTNFVDQHSPINVIGLSAAPTAASAGSFFTCAVLTTGGVQCWGNNGSGQLGINDTVALFTASPQTVPTFGPSNPVKTLAAGDSHVCALATSGNVFCWGDNAEYQLSYIPSGPHAHSATPVKISLPGPALAITSGAYFSCAIVKGSGSSNPLYCWGNLGETSGPWSSNNTAQQVAVISGGHLTISGGTDSLCSISGGFAAMVCAGDNAHGELGTYGLPSSATTWQNVQLNAGNIYSTSAVATGPSRKNNCAIYLSNNTYKLACWGDNTFGQVGDNYAEPVAFSAKQVNLDNVMAVASGLDFTCALWLDANAADVISCWGGNGRGQFGNAGTASSGVPVLSFSALLP